jgi:hypothetical protein
MEGTNAGRINFACIGQVATGMETIGSIALLLSISNPIGWGLLAIGAIGLAATIAADPTACD